MHAKAKGSGKNAHWENSISSELIRPTLSSSAIVSTKVIVDSLKQILQQHLYH